MYRTIRPLLFCFALAACAGTSPEDVQMSDALASQGKALLAKGENAQAADIYGSAVTRDDNNARAWNGLGAAYDLVGKKNKAKDAFEHAVRLAPKDLGAVNNLAHVDIEKGDADDAVDLLKPYAKNPDAPAALKQNYALAQKMASAKEMADSGVYADLGAYPTEGMANGHLTEVKKLLGREAADLHMSIEPEVKIPGGTPVFTIHATGKDPQEICDTLNEKAFPCIVGK